MEKILSEEEKIRRAEEIASRRQNGRILASNINSNEKKAKKLTTFDKLSIQVITSICIFGIIYFISQHNTYAQEKIKWIISNDTDFQKIYTEISNVTSEIIYNFGNNVENENKSENEINSDENSNMTNENVEQTNSENQINEESNKEQENNEEKGEDQNNGEQSDENKNNEEQNNAPNGIGGGDEETKVSQDVDEITYIKNKLSFVKPVSGVITSQFGERTPTDIISANHAGVDIGVNVGTDIVSAIDGIVELVSSYGDYGNHVKVTNGDISTLYAHCNKITVNVGERINQGQKIAESGSTGRTTGPHLHFEIRRNNVAIDPQKILDL